MFSRLISALRRRREPVPTVPKLHVVNTRGQLMNYQGMKLEFDPEERDRAETIAWLASRNATNGPFHVREVQVPQTPDAA